MRKAVPAAIRDALGEPETNADQACPNVRTADMSRSIVLSGPLPKQIKSRNEQQGTQPFLNVGSPAELDDENGSTYAADWAHRNTLLSEMVPTLSFVTGCNNLDILGDTRNLNMMTMKNRGGWPAARCGQGSVDWFHSDIKAIALILHPPGVRQNG
jgi:hypothetical protein